jgi:thymidylate kinase
MKKKLLILEGMSTAGKTSLQKAIAKNLDQNHHEYNLVCETLSAGVIENPDINVLGSLIDSFESGPNDLIIIDRLHVTFGAVANLSDDDFMMLEERLRKYDPVLVFLYLNEDVINERLRKAVNHRGEWWAQELTKYSDDPDWFSRTQKKLFKYYELSGLVKVAYNTSSPNFEAMAKEIIEKYI